MDQEPMCRACLSESGDAVPIFSSAETSGVQMPLSDMMMACSSVQVMSGDGLPSLICLECLRSLLIAFEFKLKCEKTDAMLREYIENNLVPMQVGTVYSKAITTIDSNNQLVPVGTTSTGQGNEIKQMVNTNELISTIPTISISNANATAIYSNTNPYIIPMVECDVLVKEEQDHHMEQKVYQKTSEGGIMLKKISVDSQANMTPTTVDMSTFSPRLISSEMIQQTPSQITIYGGHEFRDLIRVSSASVEEQQQSGTTTLVQMQQQPKMETIQTMQQCNVLTTNSYTTTLDQNQCNTIIQNNHHHQQVGVATTSNNNFIQTMTLPTNVAFTIKDNNCGSNGTATIMAAISSAGPVANTTTTTTTIRKRNVGTSCQTKIKIEGDESHEDNQDPNCHQHRYAIKIEGQEHHQLNHHPVTLHQNIEENHQQQQQPAVNKKQKTFHHKKKTVYNITNVQTDNNKTSRVNNKKTNSKNNNNQLQNKRLMQQQQQQNEVVMSIDSSETKSKDQHNNTQQQQQPQQILYQIHQQPNQGYNNIS